MYLFLSSLLLLGVVSMAIYRFFFSSMRQNNPDSLKLPPGNLGWPIIGETLDFASSRNDSYSRFFAERMNKYSHPVFKTSLLGHKMAVVCGPAGNRFAFSNENKLLVQWFPANNDKILCPNGSNNGVNSSVAASESKTFRPQVVEILKPEALSDFVPEIYSIVKKHLEEEWFPNEKVKVYPLAKNLTFDLACRLFLGVNDPELERKLRSYFVDVMAGMFSMPVNLPGTAMSRAIKAAKAIQKEFLPIIKQRRSELSGVVGLANANLLSRLVMKTDENGRHFPEELIADRILGLLIASHDTTSSVMTCVVYYLADHPHVYNRVLEEQLEILKSKGPMLQWEDVQKMKYSRNVINEVMRMVPTSLGGFKEATADLTYAGCTIPKGWKVFWSLHTTNKNPEHFPNPEKFDPSRFEGTGLPPFTFVPFGGGQRICPGSEFARLEILTFIHCLVTKFRWTKLIPDEKITSTPVPHPRNGLPIRLFPRES